MYFYLYVDLWPLFLLNLKKNNKSINNNNFVINHVFAINAIRGTPCSLSRIANELLRFESYLFLKPWLELVISSAYALWYVLFDVSKIFEEIQRVNEYA